MWLVHSKCGKKVEAVEVFAVTPQTRYVLDEEDNRFHESNVDESPESMTEEYVCQECGQALTDQEISRLQEMIADDDR